MIHVDALRHRLPELWEPRDYIPRPADTGATANVCSLTVPQDDEHHTGIKAEPPSSNEFGALDLGTARGRGGRKQIVVIVGSSKVSSICSALLESLSTKSGHARKKTLS